MARTQSEVSSSRRDSTSFRLYSIALRSGKLCAIGKLERTEAADNKGYGHDTEGVATDERLGEEAQHSQHESEAGNDERLRHHLGAKVRDRDPSQFLHRQRNARLDRGVEYSALEEQAIEKATKSCCENVNCSRNRWID